MLYTEISLMSNRKSTTLRAIADQKAADIFKCIAITNQNSDIVITKLKLTRKQYYSRTSVLTKAGLIKRKKGRFFLTAYGRIIYNTLMNFEAIVESAADNYWKLRALDYLKSSSKDTRKEIVSELIDNQDIKSILLKQDLGLFGHAVLKNSSSIKNKLIELTDSH